VRELSNCNEKHYFQCGADMNFEGKENIEHFLIINKISIFSSQFNLATQNGN
jgi:hypothetical protein